MNLATCKLAMLRLGLAAALLAASASMALAQGVDPAATRILRQMTDFMGDLRQFSVDTQNTIEVVYDSGQKIHYDFSTEVIVQRPNKIRAQRRFGQIRDTIFYDGNEITVHDAGSNYYAVAPAPDNIDDALHFARDALDIVPPSGDLIFSNSFDLLMAGVTSGTVVGKAVIGGVRCDHLAFSGPLVDWQIWIADTGKPFPLKYVITTRDDPAQPEYIVLLSNWYLSRKVSSATFTFTPPEGAVQTEFLRLDTPVR